MESAHHEKRPRVLIAEEQTIVAAGIRKLLETDCEIVGLVEDGRTLLEKAQKLCPDVIVLEVILPQLNGIDAARRLTALVPGTKLLFLTAQASSASVCEAFRAGASAYVSKRSTPSILSQAIQTLLKGHLFVCPLITKDVVAVSANGQASSASKWPLAALTPRQREVLQLVAEGRGTKDVARLLNISVKTVEFHKFKIMDQLNLHSTAALTRRAIAEGLVGL